VKTPLTIADLIANRQSFERLKKGAQHRRTILAPASKPKPLARGTKPGRPPRKTGTASPKARLLLLLDKAIAHVVYEAVLAGAPFRDEALQQGATAAEGFERQLGLAPRKLGIDAIEAIIKRLIKNQDFVYSRMPGQELRFRATMRPNRPFRNGLRTLNEKPFVPDHDAEHNPDFRLLRRVK
jgi:hypothetical protein